MPQKRKPPRLWLRTETGADGRERSTWIIIDGKQHVRTGCAEDQTAEAQQLLAEHIAGKFTPQRGGRSSEVLIAEVLIVYDEDKVDGIADPKHTRAAIARLNDFMGDRHVSDIRGKLCRAYAEHRKTSSGARRDLEVLRAACNHYHGEHGLDIMPKFTMPPKSLPRERHLTRSEAAALMWSCLGWEKPPEGSNERWKRRRDQKRSHLARLVLLGLYTGTRPGAVLSLQWMRNTTGGWADLDTGVIYRRAEGERVAHNKRKTPVKIARRLLAHMKRWRRLDGWTDSTAGLMQIVHYQGSPVIKPNKAFRSAIAAAGLDPSVTPHVLRHTRGTWLAQASVPSGEAAASLGLTSEEYERTYLHNDPAFQQKAADAY